MKYKFSFEFFSKFERIIEADSREDAFAQASKLTEKPIPDDAVVSSSFGIKEEGEENDG